MFQIISVISVLSCSISASENRTRFRRLYGGSQLLRSCRYAFGNTENCRTGHQYVGPCIND